MHRNDGQIGGDLIDGWKLGDDRDYLGNGRELIGDDLCRDIDGDVSGDFIDGDFGDRWFVDERG